MANHSALHLQAGQLAEEQACQFLLQQGLQLICKNFRCKFGELDLVMQDAHTLVIIEVRFRKSTAFGGAESSITTKKQAKIIAASQYYLSGHKINSPIRFDVVAIGANKQLNWIKNAFQT